MKKCFFTFYLLMFCSITMMGQQLPSVVKSPKLHQYTIELNNKPQSGQLIASETSQRGGGSGCIDPSLINPNAICPAIWAPVCGCDGVTYSNECEAINFGGVTSWTAGECGAIDCIDEAQIDLSVGCPLIWMPVCGCNGITYGNDCEAYYYGGVTSWTLGECGSSFCQPYFYYSNQGLNFTFFDASFGDYTSVMYDFGDGTTSSDPNPEHTFAAYGQYEVCITITGVDCEQTYCETIITEPYCQAFFFADNLCNNTVTFYNYSGAENGNVTWSFGDGTSEVNNNETFDHTYPATGFYPVCVHVTGLQCDINWCDTVFVYNEAVLPGYYETFTPSATLPVTVNFEVATVIPLPFFYVWDLGDGEFSYDSNFSHTYTNTCSPTVCLYVDGGLCNKTTCKTLDLCTTGIETITDQNINVSPNPFTDVININTKSDELATVQLMDVTGKVLITVTSTSKEQLILNTESLSEGVYILLYTSSEAQKIIKLVKK